jgi:hypothetical protein
LPPVYNQAKSNVYRIKDNKEERFNTEGNESSPTKEYRIKSFLNKKNKDDIPTSTYPRTNIENK